MKCFRFQFLILLFISSFLSCGHPRQILLSEKNNENQTIEISTYRFKNKGKWYDQIEGRIINKDNMLSLVYHISTKCGCITKIDHRQKRIAYYKAVDHLNYDLAFDSTDKFMFSKFASLPNIERYCSQNLLKSSKGFIKTNN